jgi:superfamily II RNA helicase
MKQGDMSSVSFDMDIEHELGCVVFDEMHFINDKERGHVWEQSILMLPSHVQIVGLSATLDNPEKFAHWLETKGRPGVPIEKEVYLTKKMVRPVPLIHYTFLTTTQGVNKVIKDKVLREEIRKATDELFIVQNAAGQFNVHQFEQTDRIKKLLDDHGVHIKREHVLNRVTDYLVKQEMLPALCYVFSRKQLEICASSLNTDLLEFDSKIAYTVDRECEQIIRKLPNFEEYLHLPEYVHMVKLLRKGIGMHHAGGLPILREMTEILFARGFIKILFCTETMSVGINLPVKTTIFTDVKKFDGTEIRMLLSHEYTQAAGRAGRLGLDTVGHVIHLNNLFRNVSCNACKTMMNGKPQVFQSKFKISYQLVLNLVKNGNNNLTEFVNQSMMTDLIDRQVRDLDLKIQLLMNDLEKEVFFRTPSDVIYQFIAFKKEMGLSSHKKRKELERKMLKLAEQHAFLKQDVEFQLLRENKQKGLIELQEEREQTKNTVQSAVCNVWKILEKEEMVSDELLTLKGQIACKLREIHCLIFAELLVSNRIDYLSSSQLVSLLSIFTNIQVSEEMKSEVPKARDNEVQINVNLLANLFNIYRYMEQDIQVDTGIDYHIQYDLLNYMEEWCEAQCAEECKAVIQNLTHEKGVFLGEFSRALLKIVNMASEMETIAEMTGNIAFLSKLREIPTLVMKFVVTNQSLYV